MLTNVKLEPTIVTPAPLVRTQTEALPVNAIRDIPEVAHHVLVKKILL